MCGIAGQFNVDGRPVALETVKRMCDAIRHRGPDDEGQFVQGPIGLGMRRLSIIDVGGGHQPMQNEDGSLTLVFNGEIYNYREVRANLEAKGYRFRTASDTESILHAYEEYGLDCLARLNGMFAFALWDERRQRLFIARDRLGIKPLYLYSDSSQLRFGSETKALFADRSVPRALDRDALAYFFRYGYVTPPATLFQGVRKLPAAHYLLADRDGITTHRYWDVQYHEGTQSEESYAEAVHDALKRAVERQLVADVPLGAFLSGGLDSTAIVSLMAEATGAPVNTYCVGFVGQDEFHSELADARVIARHYGTNHHEIVVRPDVAALIPELVYHLDEPLADSSFVVTYLVSKLAAESVKVILSGVGGDELFGGYRRYLGPRLSPYYLAIPRPVRRAVEAVAGRVPVDRGSLLSNYMRLGRGFVLSQHLPPFEQYDRAVRLLPEEMLAGLLSGGPAPLSSLDADRREWFEGSTGVDPVTGMMHLDLKTALPESLLLLTDKMSMAVSLEARVPFLDHQLVELAAGIPGRLKVNGTTLRYIQKQAMRPSLPDHVFRKRKRGFGFPIGAWFRRELRGLAEDTLSAKNLGRHGLFDVGTARSLLEDHFERRHDYSDVLLALLTFELWYDRWIASA